MAGARWFALALLLLVAGRLAWDLWARVRSTEPLAVLVEVEGAVDAPGLYALSPPVTVADAVTAAGGGPGALAPSWKEHVLADGDRVVLASGGAVEVTDSSRPLLMGIPLDVNTATGAELEAVPGIGPARAAAIVEDRETLGPFPDLASLRRVSGIGKATVEKLSVYLEARLPHPGPDAPAARAPAGTAATEEPSASTGPADGGSDASSPGAGEVYVMLPVDVNTASEPVLDALPGIGPSRARALVHERMQGGPFRDIEDLQRVKGIGPVTADKLAPFVTFGDPGVGGR